MPGDGHTAVGYSSEPSWTEGGREGERERGGGGLGERVMEL